jgi:hypothetical protein
VGCGEGAEVVVQQPLGAHPGAADSRSRQIGTGSQFAAHEDGPTSQSERRLRARGNPDEASRNGTGDRHRLARGSCRLLFVDDPVDSHRQHQQI